MTPFSSLQKQYEFCLPEVTAHQGEPTEGEVHVYPQTSAGAGISVKREYTHGDQLCKTVAVETVYTSLLRYNS